MKTPKARLRAATRTVALTVALCAATGHSARARAQDVSFEIHTGDGRSQYHVGQPFDLQLIFSSANRQYPLDSSFRYPDLQPTQDAFLVEPKGGSEDPLDDYRRALSSSQIFAGYEGMGGVARLGDKPVVLVAPLNRCVRFTKPGQYLLKVSSRRVSRMQTSLEDAPQVIATGSPSMPARKECHEDSAGCAEGRTGRRQIAGGNSTHQG